MESPVRKLQKRNDYNRHKLLRKIKRRRKAAAEQQAHAAEKALKKKLRVTPPKFEGGKNTKDIDITYVDNPTYNEELGLFKDDNGRVVGDSIVLPELEVTPQLSRANEFRDQRKRFHYEQPLETVSPEFEAISLGRGLWNDVISPRFFIRRPVQKPNFTSQANVLGLDPTRLGYTGKLWRNNPIGRRLANSRFFKVPTFEEMNLKQAVDEGKRMQYTDNVLQDWYSYYNTMRPTQINKVSRGFDGNAIANALPWNNEINLSVPDALPFWRRNRYIRLQRGIAKHEAAHLTQPQAYNLTDSQIEAARSGATDKLLPISTFDESTNYYVVNPNSPKTNALQKLSADGRAIWTKSPDEVMSELANLGELGLLKHDGIPTNKGFQYLSKRFNLPEVEIKQLVYDLNSYHNNFYTGNSPYTNVEAFLNNVAKDDVKYLKYLIGGMGAASTGFGTGYILDNINNLKKHGKGPLSNHLRHNDRNKIPKKK